MRRPVTAALAAAAPLALLPIAPVTAAEPLACGTVVTEDVTLTADLTCEGTALVVGADGVTIDLGGHTVTAPQVVESVDWDRGVGSSYTLRNGTAAGDVGAAFVIGTAPTTFERLTLVDARVGCSDATLELRDSTLRNSHVDGTSCRADIRRNRFEGGGIRLWTTAGAITDNVLRGGERGVHLAPAAEMAVTRNSITGFTEAGIEIVGGGLRSGGATVVADNTLRGNGTGILYHADPANASATSTIRRNTVSRSSGTGIEIDYEIGDSSVDVTLDANRAIANGGHGIAVTVAGARPAPEDRPPFLTERIALVRNTAVLNAGTGIAAADDEAVVDDGGNRAVANRGGACTGVACR